MSKHHLIASILVLLQCFCHGNAEEHIGGHTRDYHILDKDSALGWNKMVTHWHQEAGDHLAHEAGRVRRDVSTPSLDDIEKFVKTFETAFMYANEKLTELINNTAVLTGRLKSASSIQEKLVRKNATLDDLTDVIGLRITCQTVNETVRIKDLVVEAKQYFNVTEIECKGICPGQGKYLSTGYRRIHMLFEIGQEGKTAELQIGTPYTDMWSDWNHDFIYKGPKAFAKDPSVISYNLAMAEYFWQLDEDRRMLPPCPPIMKKANALKVLRDGVAGDHAEATYKKLGYPPNSCFWWNDMKLALQDPQCPKTTSASAKAIIAGWTVLFYSLLPVLSYGL